jgi:type II secretory pathway pseudopilin PulG
VEKIRTNNNSKESGIALVTALVITVVVLMLISSLTYLFTKGFQTNIINRQFSTVYEAANGGVEYTTGLVNAFLSGTTPSDTAADANFSCVSNCNCTPATTQSVVSAKTADGTYTITTTIQCLGNKPIPGYGGALKFPPPPALAGGGTGSATKYIFYSISSQATETTGSTNIGKTEAIYRVIQ